MKSEDEPITDDEWLLRRVWHERFVPVLSPNAFEPRLKGRDRDTDGISLHRQACLPDPSAVLVTVAPEKRHLHGIVRIPMSLLRSLGLSVVSKPEEQIKGHVVIPELNADDYESDKARFTPIKLRLATEASKDENILRRPSPAEGPEQP